ncbi:MAG: hypothetical protein WA208_04565 [Thermoanaerobaculia bacterium]
MNEQTAQPRARLPRRVRPEAPIGDDAFACEIAIALDAIEKLTHNEAGSVMDIAQEANCEPLLPFLALHFRLAYVLGSPHGREFRSALRAWRANDLLDATLWRFFGVQYRPRYRPGFGSPEDVAEAVERFKTSRPFDLIGVGPARPVETQSVEERRGILRSLAVGDVVEWCFDGWKDSAQSKRARVVRVTPRVVYVCKVGRKTRQSLTSIATIPGCALAKVTHEEAQR